MKVTSTEAAKKVKELSEKFFLLKNIEDKSKIFYASVGENPEDLRPEYDFVKISNEMAEIQAEIRHIKHAINCFNTTQKLDAFDMTIDEVLVFMPQLSAEKSRLMKMSQQLPKQRRERYNSNIVDYEIANYDIDLVKQELERVTKLLSEIQTELNKINSTVTFEI